MSTPDDRTHAEEMVAMATGDRLELAGEPPGVRLATTDGVLGRLQSITARMGEQFEHLRSGSSRRIPDAYFADEQETENELQKVGAGLRTAMALGGFFGDALEIERSFAADLASVGVWARLSEASRVPRPCTRPAAFDWSLTPIPWVEDGSFAWPPTELVGLNGIRQLVGDETVRVRVREAPFTDWVQLGFVERQRTFATRHPESPKRQVFLMSGVEVGDRPPQVNGAPLSRLPPELWMYPYAELISEVDQDSARGAVATMRGPLAGLVSYEQTSGAPSVNRGLGLHEFCLTSRVEVVALLGLRPETPTIRHVLVDKQGPGIVCRQWRSYLIHAGDYGPLEPAVIGADLIIRPDLFETLEAAIGGERFRLGLSVGHRQGWASDDDAHD